MCGIAGIYYYKDQKEVKQEDLTKMNNALNHRGPDSKGFYISDNQRLGFSHNRLSIIDPTPSANQPFNDEKNENSLIFNGYISNYKSFKFKNLRTKSDTEILFNKFLKNQENCLHELNGMFAFAFWSEKDKCLTLARDHIGIKPLYYYLDKEKIVFASEIKAILTLSNINKTLNPYAINQYFTNGYITTPNTPFNEIKQLPPGHYLTVKNEKIDIKRYFKFQVKDYDQSHSQDHEKLLIKTISNYISSDVPFTSFLSGGIDSTVVASTLSNSGTPPSVTTYNFTNPLYSEKEDAKSVANKLNLPLNIIDEGKPLLSNLKKIAYYNDDLICDPSLIPSFDLFKGTSLNFKMALSADGGDELFLGYPTYTASIIKNFIPRIVHKPLGFILSLISEFYPYKESRYSHKENLKRFSNGLILPFPKSHQSWRDIFFPRDKKILYTKEFQRWSKKDISPSFSNFFKPQDNFLNKCSLLDFHTYLESNLLKKVDRMAMANSIEVRVPLLDRTYMDYALNLPINSKIGFKGKKLILKDYLKKTFNSNIIKKKKTGFSPDLSRHLLSHDLLKEFNSLNKDAQFFNYINKENLFVILNDQKQVNRNSKLVYSILNFKFWLDHYSS
jgi:asparagine synthase (glutamine-hydrolysing)